MSDMDRLPCAMSELLAKGRNVRYGLFAPCAMSELLATGGA